jgi:ABC-2 type transport system permease protein
MKRLLIECRLAASRPLLLIAALFLGAAAAALWNGWQWRAARSSAVEAERQRGADELATVRRELAAIEAKQLDVANASLPTRFLGRFAHRALLPPAALSTGAIGEADWQPFAAQVSLYSVKHSLLDKHQIEDPLALLIGRFDLAFLLIYLLPLVILAFTYDVVSAERERGTLTLAVAQSGSLARMLRAKIAARGVLLALLIALPLLALALTTSLFGVVLWAAIIAAYAVFWMTLSVAVNLLGRSSAVNATMLAGAWIVLLLVVPAALNLYAARQHPLPSRLDALAKIRRINLSTAESGDRLLNQFLQEHPDLAAERNESGSGQYFAIRQSQERNILPLVTALERQLAQQQATIARYRVLSPAIGADELLLDVAGTGRVRSERYRDQLRAFLDRWRGHFVGRAFRGGLVTPAELDGMPRFAFAEESGTTLGRRTARGIALLLLPALLLVAFSTWRLRTFRGI